jgi:putative flippase GtrA
MEAPTLTRTAISATLHCLTGCALGEVLGLVLATAFGWPNGPSIAISIALAFVFGYLLTTLPLLRAGLSLRAALALALASDTLSITTMEIVDSLIVLAVPGAMAAGLGDPLFWGSLAFALFIAFWVAVPVNRWLIARGKGHAVIHAHHAH